MKRAIIFTLLASAVYVQLNAQPTNTNGTEKIKKADDTETYVLVNQPLPIGSYTLVEGQNQVTVPQTIGKHITFLKRGSSITNVMLLDASGKSITLSPVQGGMNGAPSPGCKYPLPDACFATANKNIGMCICKPSDLSVGYTLNFYQKKHLAGIKYND